MSEEINPLYYHYETGIKLEYFILSADVALLGWTIVNTEWLPKETIYTWLISGFWILITFSLTFGIIRQLLNGMVFGLNYHYLHSGKLANVIERGALQGGHFMDQQTGEIKDSEEFKKFAAPHRENEKKAKDQFKEYSNKSRLFANLSTSCLVAGLFLLSIIKIYILLN